MRKITSVGEKPTTSGIKAGIPPTGLSSYNGGPHILSILLLIAKSPAITTKIRYDLGSGIQGITWILLSFEKEKGVVRIKSSQ